MAAIASFPEDIQAQKPNFTHVSMGAEQKGDLSFYNFAYSDAVEKYQFALSKDSLNAPLKFKIAECYRILNEPMSAETWYQQAIEGSSRDFDPVYYLNYAQALKSNQKYEEAQKWYEAYLAKAGIDRRGANGLDGLKNLEQYFKDSISYEITKLSINTKHSDFSPAYFGNQLVFVSAAKPSLFVKDTYNWDESTYLDLFKSDISDDLSLQGTPHAFSKKINTKYHEGPTAFYDSARSAVFTRNNYFDHKAKRSQDGINKLKLYFSTVDEDGEWREGYAFSFNSDEFSTGHPTITEDGKKMIFASDRPGGYGGTDLYVTYRVRNKWSKPANLGKLINTEADEMFPFLKDNKLFFASNGHGGLGGLDVFKTELVKDKPQAIKNLGAPINSSLDDFGLITNDDMTLGYFSSGRNPETKDDIYQFRYTRPANVLLSGSVQYVVDGSTISNPEVQLMKTGGGSVLKTVTADENGFFQIEMPWAQEFQLAASKEGYDLVNKIDVSTFGNDNEIKGLIINLRKFELIAVAKAMDKSSNELIQAPNISLYDTQDSVFLKPFNIENDEFKFLLTPDKIYAAKGEKHEYFAGYDTLSTVGINDGAIVSNILLEKIEIGKTITLDNIYYDLGKATLRPEALVELDKLLLMLKQNPEIRIELSSHTDSRGSNSHNLQLSQRRANSAVNYILSNGIARDIIVAKGYGEKNPVNRCVDGVKCSSFEHQQNRRTEFKVVGFVQD